jgi:uncharacterized protein
LLRGPQTPGELRSRAERMQHFDDLGIVQSTLRRLMEREPSLVKILPRLPGTKEARYAHLLSGDVQTYIAEPPSVTSSISVTPAPVAPPDTISGAPASVSSNRIAHLENQVAELQKDIADLKQQFAAFRKQFE